MRRSAILFVMLIAMLWQSLALARSGFSLSPLADLTHAALHLQQAGHHHHGDGSYHTDDSTESIQHLIADHPNASATLSSACMHGLPPIASSSPDSLQPQAVPHPYLDGLLRPPRTRS